jgi:DNA modification methylase
MKKIKGAKEKQYFFGDEFLNPSFADWCKRIERRLKKSGFDNGDASILHELDQIFQNYISNKSKEIRNKQRLELIDNKKEKKVAKELLSKEDIKKLPDWIKGNIDKAYVIGRSKKVISLNGKKFHLDNPLNDLPGGEWTYFLRSVINTRYSTSGREGYAHNIRKIHPSPKPPQLMRDIISFFTKKDEWVLDYFMGVGGTLIGASLCERRALGIDLNKDYLKSYKAACKALGLIDQPVLCGNSLTLLGSDKIQKMIGEDKISFICIDPPYGDMMSREKTGEAIKKKQSTAATPFTNLEHDLGNVEKEDFLVLLKESVKKAVNYLKNGRYLVVFTKDFQPTKKSANLLHADIIYKLNEISNLKYVGMKIWADESINLYPYGYPWAYVSNQLHQYILVFRKDR